MFMENLNIEIMRTKKCKFERDISDYENTRIYLWNKKKYNSTIKNYRDKLFTLVDQARLNVIIDQNTCDFLKVKHPRIPTFYTLPKVHKSIRDPPGRPIVSGCGSLTEPISEFIDLVLQPLEIVTKLNVKKFNLSFTMNYDSSKLEFFDIEIKKDSQGLVSTNLLRKLTASNSLLHAKSMHPSKSIEGIPKGHSALSHLVPPRPLFTYKHYTSIGDMLTQSHFQKHTKKTCCKTPASFSSCEQCCFIKLSNTLEGVNLDLTCKTKRQFNRRIYEHLLDIKNCNLLSSIAKHIHCMHKRQFAGSYFQGIDRLHGNPKGGDLDNRLLQLETTWIFRLNTIKFKFGLNGHLQFQAFIN
ncbi:hypothetical protein XELAEV_18022946mg [Xenopus laevis]|uniref:Uncharacterized protein n=1 Tax=Xenopus laevis TaxID=8355 RepID=A0A974D374_XENLA|nr:hypothetical protein XELAEV_18022946mg [Xenopus laevis]